MNLDRLLIFPIAALSLMLLNGCVSTSTANPFLSTRDGHARSQPILTNVAVINVVNDYFPHGEEPYVDHKLSPTPAISIEEWLQEKVKASGTKGRLTLRIQEASLRWRKRPGKLRAMKYWPYRAIVRINVEHFDENGEPRANFPIQVMRVREIHEGFLRMPSHKDWWKMFADIQKDLAFELRRKLPPPPMHKR